MPKIALSMTQVMNDLAQTGSQVRVVLLDGARPIPAKRRQRRPAAGVDPADPGDGDELRPLGRDPRLRSAAQDRRRQRRLRRRADGSAATALCRRRHDAAGDPPDGSPGDAGGQTPWHASASATPPFAYPVGATAQQIAAAAAGLPITPAALSSLPADVAYWSAIWRNTAEDDKAYLDAFGATAPQDQAERVRMLLALLSEPNPTCARCRAGAVTVIGGVYCPDVYDGFCQPPAGCTGWGCLPPPPPPCVPWHWGCGLPPPPLWCVPWHPGCPGPSCIPWHPGCPGPSCIPWHPGCPTAVVRPVASGLPDADHACRGIRVVRDSRASRGIRAARR